jgi:hypothetical protein
MIDVLTREMQGTTTPASVAGVAHLILTPHGNQTDWMGTDVDLTGYGSGLYWYTQLGDGTLLFLPKSPGLQPALATIVRASGTLVLRGTAPYSPSDLSQLQGDLLSSVSLGTAYVLSTATSGWDWLQLVQLAPGYVAGIFNSAPIQMTIKIQGNCNDISCEGCPTVQIQRYCLAYNKCALINCVGTTVNQRKPLCGVGGLLRQNGKMALRSTNAAWTVFSEMLGLILELNLLTMRGARVLWPEDAFLCYICDAKDARCPRECDERENPGHPERARTARLKYSRRQRGRGRGGGRGVGLALPGLQPLVDDGRPAHQEEREEHEGVEHLRGFVPAVVLHGRPRADACALYTVPAAPSSSRSSRPRSTARSSWAARTSATSTAAPRTSTATQTRS